MIPEFHNSNRLSHVFEKSEKKVEIDAMEDNDRSNLGA